VNIDGISDLESFGTNLAFSADGGIMVGVGAAPLVVNSATNNSTIMTGQVRAYKYLTDTDEWKPLGEYLDDPVGGILQPNKVSLSPNGKFLAICSFPSSGANFVRVFALNTDTNADDSVIVWEQIGMNVASPPGSTSSSFGHALSLTDNLVLAVSSDYNPGQTPGKIYTFSFDSSLESSGGWGRMGQELEHYGNSLRLIRVGMGSMLMAVGGLYRARTFRYDPDASLWNQYGPDLPAPMPSNPTAGSVPVGGVQVDFSADGSLLAVGSEQSDGGSLVRFFSYEEDWIQLGNDLQDPGFVFGAFDLSANGKVLATATHELSTTISMPNEPELAVGQIRIWDLVASKKNVFNGSGGRGEWVQRSGPLARGIPGSLFGWKVVLSRDGGRLAASAPMGFNRQGVRSGKVRVFELL
jgi:hypothetical protein